MKIGFTNLYINDFTVYWCIWQAMPLHIVYRMTAWNFPFIFFYSMIIPNVIFTWFKFNFVFHRNNIQNQKWVSLYLSQSDFQITYFITVCFTICFSHVNTTSTELLSTLRVSPDTVKCHNSIQILFQLILINSHQFSLTLYLLSLFLAAP